VMMHRIGMHGEVGYLVFRHRQTNANPRSRGKWRQNACVCVCVYVNTTTICRAVDGDPMIVEAGGCFRPILKRKDQRPFDGGHVENSVQIVNRMDMPRPI
jgi:hypothetical protein